MFGPVETQQEALLTGTNKQRGGPVPGGLPARPGRTVRVRAELCERSAAAGSAGMFPADVASESFVISDESH